MRFPLTFVSKDSVLTRLFVMNIYFVLEIICENLFAVSQSITLALSQVTEICSFSKLMALSS